MPTLTPDARVTRWMIVILLAAFFAADVIATQVVFTSRVPGANDFFVAWESARSFWRDGLSPYSDDVRMRVQIGMYGRPARPDEDPGPFAYPFYIVLTLWPLVWWSYSWVQAFWITLLEFLIVAITLMSLWLLRWKPAPLTLAACVLGTLFFYNSARAIVLGQYAIVVAACVIGALVALRAERDWLAGILLGLSTIKPQMAFLTILYVLLWCAVRRRWKVIGGLAVTMSALIGLSFLLLPSWVSDFLRGVQGYTMHEIGSPVWIITQYYLRLGSVGEWIVSGAIGLALVAAWPRTLRDDWGAFMWMSHLTLVVSNLIALRTATTNYVIFYPAMWLVARAMLDHWPGYGRWLAALSGVALLVGLWVLFAMTVTGKAEHPLVYLPLPFGLALILVIWRRALVVSAHK